MKIAVLGGGAMGGLFGGYLARAGKDVVLVDVSDASIPLANEPRVFGQHQHCKSLATAPILSRGAR